MRRIDRQMAATQPGAVPSTGPKLGFVLTYRVGYTNFCPGCGASHWHVGRTTAECAWCATALPIAAMAYDRPAPMAPAPSVWRTLVRAA